MAVAVLTSKGQLTIPKLIRQHLHLDKSVSVADMNKAIKKAAAKRFTKHECH